MSKLTQEILKREVDYNPDTGSFFRKDGSLAGGQGGTPNYRVLSICNKQYREHRLAFLWMEGDMPEFVDHVDGDKLNNKWSNLRKCTRQENNRNSATPACNTSGVKGVSWSTPMRKWRARIMVDYKEIIIGYFDCIAAAEQAVKKARKDIYKEFACNDR